eukprot:30990-Pelagococcus_subviridis.AAC.5
MRRLTDEMRRAAPLARSDSSHPRPVLTRFAHSGPLSASSSTRGRLASGASSSSSSVNVASYSHGISSGASSSSAADAAATATAAARASSSSSLLRRATNALYSASARRFAALNLGSDCSANFAVRNDAPRAILPLCSFSSTSASNAASSRAVAASAAAWSSSMSTFFSAAVASTPYLAFSVGSNSGFAAGVRDGSIRTTRPVRPDPAAASGLTSALRVWDFRPPWWMHGFPGWQHPDSFPEAPIGGFPSRSPREID